ARIIHIGDVMRPVAVVAFCRIGVAKARNLAMVGFEVGLGNFRMAPAAGVHDAEFEAGIIGAANGVRGMAGTANREFLAGMGDGWRVDAVDELRLNAAMA